MYVFRPDNNRPIQKPKNPTFYVTVEVNHQPNLLTNDKPSVAMMIVPTPWICEDVKECLWTRKALENPEKPHDQGKTVVDILGADDIKYLLANYWPRQSYIPFNYLKTFGPSKKKMK